MEKIVIEMLYISNKLTVQRKLMEKYQKRVWNILSILSDFLRTDAEWYIKALCIKLLN